MHARQQIDEAQYRAARKFQEAADRATLGTVRSIDLTKTKVSGGLPPDPLTPDRQRAMKWLRHAEQQLMHRHGAEGLGLTRAILVERQSVEQTARLRERRDRQGRVFLGQTFPSLSRCVGLGVRLCEARLTTWAIWHCGTIKPYWAALKRAISTRSANRPGREVK